MSFGGSVLAMITSLKNNSRGRKKAFDLWKEDSFIIHKRKTPLRVKKVSALKLRRIKIRIREKARKDRKRERILMLAILVPVLVMGFLFVKYRVDRYNEKKRLEEKARLEWIEKEKTEKEQSIVYYLNDGYKWLDRGNYKNAKIQFYNARTIDKNDFRIDYANAKVYVLDCINNSENCKIALKLVNGLAEKYKYKQEVKELEELLHNN